MALALLGSCRAAHKPALLHKHCSSLVLGHFHLWVPWTWLCYLYMSRAIPKSPILATLPGPRQVRRQFLAAISLRGKRRKATEREDPFNYSTILQAKKKTKKSTCFSELQRAHSSQKSHCLWLQFPIYPTAGAVLLFNISSLNFT